MKIKICEQCGNEYKTNDKDMCSKLCKSCKEIKYFNDKHIECEFCGEEFITQGNKKICSNKQHYFRCSVCGKDIEAETLNKFMVGYNKLKPPLYIIENSEDKCIFTTIYCPCLDCRVKYITNAKRAQSVKDTFMERYGVSSPVELHQVQQKARKAYEENKEEIIKKKLETERNNHEGNLAFHTNEAKEKASISRRSKKSREKYKSTMMERYNVESPSQSKLIRNKIEETTFKNHGVRYGINTKKSLINAHTKDAQRRREETTLLNHGVRWYIVSEECRKSKRKTKPNIEFHDLLLEALEIDFKYEKKICGKFLI